jgi:hypothetical protein
MWYGKGRTSGALLPTVDQASEVGVPLRTNRDRGSPPTQCRCSGMRSGSGVDHRRVRKSSRARDELDYDAAPGASSMAPPLIREGPTDAGDASVRGRLAAHIGPLRSSGERCSCLLLLLKSGSRDQLFRISRAEETCGDHHAGRLLLVEAVS